MNILIRIIGIIWALFSLQNILELFNRLIHSGIHLHLSLAEGLDLILFISGIGLIFLKDWARLTLQIGAGAYLVLKVLQPLLQSGFRSELLTPLVYYGFFLVLLSLPQTKQVTH